jgi:ATP-dependent DNA helicase 2 subunit 2
MEFGKPENTYNPTLNRTLEAVKFRAVHPPGTELPGPSEILTRYTNPPKDALARSKSALDSVIKNGGIKKVDKKEKSRRERRKAKPASDLNIDDLLNDKTYRLDKISLENAIPDFKRLLDKTDQEDQVKSISKQLGAIIKKVISDSVGNLSYERAIEMIRTMREELEELEMPEVYNGIAGEFKSDLLKEKLGGDRKEMWYLMRRNKLGLLEVEEDKGREVSVVDCLMQR